MVINASVHASEQENYSKKEPVVKNFVLGNLSPGSKKRKLENDDCDGDLDNYDDDMDGIWVLLYKLIGKQQIYYLNKEQL